MLFLKSLVKNLSYLQNLDIDVFYEILFKMDRVFYQTGDTILKYGQQTDKLIFVVNGELEVYTECEGNEFVLERLK